MADIGALTIVLPPLLEQVAIVNGIREQTTDFDTAIDRNQREIDLLREYRTTLTADVVTGKLDVREAVKHLPAEAEEPPPADDLLDDDIEDGATEEVDSADE
jgi:type I restriction enzyme S subunit